MLAGSCKTMICFARNDFAGPSPSPCLLQPTRRQTLSPSCCPPTDGHTARARARTHTHTHTHTHPHTHTHTHTHTLHSTRITLILPPHRPAHCTATRAEIERERGSGRGTERCTETDMWVRSFVDERKRAREEAVYVYALFENKYVLFSTFQKAAGRHRATGANKSIRYTQHIYCIIH